MEETEKVKTTKDKVFALAHKLGKSNLLLTVPMSLRTYYRMLQGHSTDIYKHRIDFLYEREFPK